MMPQRYQFAVAKTLPDGLRLKLNDRVTAGYLARLEAKPGPLGAYASTVVALKSALERAGVEFIEENGGGPGVRLRKHQRPKQTK